MVNSLHLVHQQIPLRPRVMIAQCHVNDVMQNNPAERQLFLHKVYMQRTCFSLLIAHRLPIGPAAVKRTVFQAHGFCSAYYICDW